MAEVITLPEEKPYFIISRKKDKVFTAVKEITPEYDEEEKSWSWEADDNEEVGRLELGLNLIETPNIDFRITVRTPEDYFGLGYIIQTLRNLAENSGHDCFTTGSFGGYVAHFLKSEGDLSVYEVKPRLFRLKSIEDLAR